MNGPSAEVCVVMPVFNEEACIEKVAEDWKTVLQTIAPFKLLLVDDGSTDGTPIILKKLAVQNGLIAVHQPNAGHGAAVINGYRRALDMGTSWIFQTDSDDQFNPADFKKLWVRRNESPFILGTRSPRRDPLFRRLIAFFHTALIFIGWRVRIEDPNIAFRLMRADFLRSLLYKSSRWDVFAPNMLLSVLARTNGARTLDVPVACVDRKTGSSTLKPFKLISICWRCVYELARLRVNP